MKVNSVSHRFTLADLATQWQGSAENQAAHIDITLQVDRQGNVYGSGIKTIWRISGKGSVKGAGSFTFVDEGKHIITHAVWNLKLNIDKNRLHGDLHVRDERFDKMKIELIKVKQLKNGGLEI